ncbi:MAG: ABC transporter ATP-binding protein/permease [Clostridia bacterium]|nr:ABC transporter ATP-binding protein/permease [Clostridia bacterium]
MLEIRNVTKIYHSKSGTSVKALDDVSISFSDTGMVFILGKSGSGKSTLLNVIGGLDSCDSGEFVIKGKSSRQFAGSDFDAYRNTFIGFIFQEYNILDDFTVGANIGLALELQGRKADNAKISDILSEVDLLDYAKRKPNELSGGQKQRVAIARALVKDPEIIMADEPTGALDSNTGKQIFDTLKELSKKKLVIIVSHDRDFAERYADRIIEMKDGRIFSDVTRHAVSAEEMSDGILKMTDNLLRIEKGYQLTAKDVKMINEYLRTRDSDVLISSDSRLNAGVRSAAGIAEDNTSSVFNVTDERRDVRRKDYMVGEARFIRSSLPMKNALKMGGSSLGHKKFRLVVTVFLSLIAFALFGFADTMGAYNKCRAAVESIRDSNIRYAAYSLGVRESYSYPDGDSHYYYSTASMNEDDIEYLKEKLGTDFIPVFNGSNDTWTSISLSSMMQSTTYVKDAYQGVLYGFAAPTETQISELGYTVTGTLPSGENEVAISRLVYEMLNANGFINDSKNESVKAGSLTTDVSGGQNSIIGKHLSLNMNGRRFEYEITAVVDTGFDYNRYAAYIPDTSGQQQGEEDDGGLADIIMQMELENTLRYGFHNLAFVSSKGLQQLEDNIPVYSFDYIGTSMNWSSTLRGENENGDVYDVAWLNFVADSSVLAQLDVEWIDGTSRTKLGDKEMVVSSIVLDQVQMPAVDLSERVYGVLREMAGSAWKDEYRDMWVSEVVRRVALEKEIEAHFDEYRAQVAQLYWEGATDDELKQCWLDNYEWVRQDIGADNLKTEEELLREPALYILENILGEDLIRETNAREIKNGNALISIVDNLSREISLHDIVYTACNLYGYSEAYRQGATLYESDAFKNCAFERYGYDQDSWNDQNSDEKYRIAAEIIASYVMNTQYYKDGYFVEMDKNAYIPPVDKTYSDFAPHTKKVYFDLTGTTMKELLEDFYLHVSSWMDGEKETDYRDYKIVGIFSNGEYNDLIVSDDFSALYEDFCVEYNIGKQERYPHEAGAYAYALGVMPQDEDAILRMVEFSYDESEGLSFYLQNQVMDTLGNFNDFIEIGAKVFLYIGIGFAVFSALMLMNFISISISYKRREIGILRAVGARSSDVFKIFFCEAFMIALINYVLSLAATITAVTVFNTIVRNEGLNVTLLNFGARQVVLMFVISLFVAAVASFLPVWNIARRKPIDAIKNK